MNKRIYTIVFYFLMPLMLLVLPFAIPLFDFGLGISDLLTTVSLVFAVLVGFFIAGSTTNYLQLRSFLAEENNALINIFLLVKVFQPGAARKVADKIDDYLISAYDFELIDYVSKTTKQIDELIKTISKLKPKNAMGIEAFGAFLNFKCDLIRLRQQIEVVSRKIITPVHWFLISLLFLVLNVLIYSQRGDSIVLIVIIGIISIVAYLTLVLLYEIDNNLFLEEKFSFELAQGVFLLIGKLRYYPSWALKNRRIKKPVGEYRLGKFKDYPHSLSKKIIIVKNK